MDNALAEARIGLCKAELIDRHPRTWSGWAEVERATAAWVVWCSTARLHPAIGYLPPLGYEQRHRGHAPGASSVPEVAWTKRPPVPGCFILVLVADAHDLHDVDAQQDIGTAACPVMSWARATASYAIGCADP